MDKWRRIRTSLLFGLSLAFAALFAAGMLTGILTDAEIMNCAVPPFLGFCFTFPLWRRNVKRNAAARGK